MRDYRTAHQVLSTIAQIEDREARKEALRKEVSSNSPLAIIIQYTYHPDVDFGLPVGPIPKEVARKSKVDDGGAFYSQVRRMKYLFDPEVPQRTKERQFISIYEGIEENDADVFVGVKDKRFPWPELDAEFCGFALPELFPTGVTEKPPFDPITIDTTKSVIPKISAEDLASIADSLGQTPEVVTFSQEQLEEALKTANKVVIPKAPDNVDAVGNMVEQRPIPLERESASEEPVKRGRGRPKGAKNKAK